MKLKKILAGMTALVCCAGALAFLPEFTESAKAKEVVSNDFEVTYGGWYGNADYMTIEAVEGVGTDTSRGMQVTGRQKPSDGASSSKGFYLYGGVNYQYSVKVFSEKAENYRLSLLCIDQNTGEETVSELAVASGEAGTWTELTANYTAPKDSYEFKVTITTDNTDDFIFDDFKVVSEDYKSLTAVAASTQKGLKDEFAPYFRVGNILNGGTVQNSAITANILKDYNSIECENELKPDATINQAQCSGTNVGVSLQRAASILDFCSQNGIAMRGHTLVWHSQTPGWFFKTDFNSNGQWVDKNTMDARMESYIKNMFAELKKQYPNLNLYAYDVCNECVSDSDQRTKNNGGAREAGDSSVQGQGGKSAWVQVYGDNSFVEKAFTYARKYAPEGCDLYYNDYNEYWDHKRDCIYNMCKSLYQKGLLDGVGMQSHVPANATGFAGTDSYIQAMKMYLSIGCDVQITELDISLNGGQYSLQDQANKYKAIFQAAMDWNTNPQSTGRVTAVCIWGPNDANSWLDSGSDALLYDKNNQPKLAYNTLIGMIPESEWGDGSSPAQGEVKPVEPNEFGWYFDDGFEGDTCSWTGRGAASVANSSMNAFVGSQSLYVDGRTASWNGATKSLSTRTFVPGEEYSFSAIVRYDSGPETDIFHLTLQYNDAAGDPHYDKIATTTGVKGAWVQLANTNFKIPAGATDLQLYVETDDSTTSFYIDEVIGAVAGTGVKGPDPVAVPIVTPSTAQKADINNDGVINIFDLMLAKKVAMAGTANKAADVDESGKVDADDIKQIQDYLHGRIKTFTVVEKPVTKVDTTKMDQLFASVSPTASYKKDTENNPLYTQRFGADPGVMEYNGRVYVYMTDDTIEYDSNGKVQENGYGLIKRINCISSDDMVNWTDHGAIPVAGSNGIAKFAGNSWAPCAAHKKINGKEKFFLYFCNGGNGVCVLTADSPTGPWSDPLGAPLVSRSVPNTNVPWLFDPAVFVDNDGTGYLVFGGGVPEGKQAMPSTTRVVKLADDMIHLDGTPITIDAPYVFEDSGINRIGNKYYYTYCSNWNTGGNQYGLSNAGIQYMVADNPLGPYTYGGEFFKNQGTFFPGMTGNNHHSIVELNGQLYLFYHSRPVEKAMGIDGNYRSPQVDKITMSGDKINAVTGTMTGIAQLKKVSPYDTNQAETMSNQSKDISVSGLGDTTVNFKKGSWMKVSGVDFSKGATTMTIKASSTSGAAVKVCTALSGGETVAYAEIPAGGMTEISVPVVNAPSGSSNLFFLFSGDASFDTWSFS